MNDQILILSIKYILEVMIYMDRNIRAKALGYIICAQRNLRTYVQTSSNKKNTHVSNMGLTPYYLLLPLFQNMIYIPLFCLFQNKIYIKAKWVYLVRLWRWKRIKWFYDFGKKDVCIATYNFLLSTVSVRESLFLVRSNFISWSMFQGPSSDLSNKACRIDCHCSAVNCFRLGPWLAIASIMGSLTPSFGSNRSFEILTKKLGVFEVS